MATQEELEEARDPILFAMKKRGEPITRENYIRNNYGRQIPNPWTIADETDLPEFLQDHDRFPQLRDA